MSARIDRFTPIAIFICAGLLIWAADFLIIYVVAAVACAKGYEQTTIAGIPFVAFVGTAVTLVAAGGTWAVLHVAILRLKKIPDADTSLRFVYFLAGAIATLGLLAMLFNVLPAWLLATQCVR
jgi:hypothetical protein